ncbi:hypothetical protein A3J13_02110 [Candidatus Daviesbacteria bacterium RIFCSPLOWO2_02_FULL_36_8]|uniref:Methyltransferase domain-containing protein n=1 Tax=Candidatus Daviesbacteria bacterium RIFCSPLOWO2_02_FULL_36_8 TaxID=1797793 RepID=A0A1F5MFD9_9BACT|nr:MAG: hypothetical protein A3J13_02110 [Candidatus Daviesbacteria bacterium RIFCSPLOWO2_02_FULL_36_8]
MADNESKKFWDDKHLEGDELSKMSQHSVFAEQSLTYFPYRAKVIDLGCGTGADSLFFLHHGCEVLATDYSQPALKELEARAKGNLNLAVKQLDLSETFPFADQAADVIYSHLSLHYFDGATTQQIFDEIHRVLKPNGVVAVLLNSFTDEEYGHGEQIEDGYFNIPDKGPKRYFSTATLKPFIKRFETIVLDYKGSDPRRNHKEDLVRFIGKKAA